MVNKKIKISYTYPSYDLHLTGSLFFHLRLCVSMIPAWFLVAWAFPTFPGGLFSPNKYYGLKWTEKHLNWCVFVGVLLVVFSTRWVLWKSFTQH